MLTRRAASFAPDLASAGAARRLLQAVLSSADRLQWADAGALALSEVVTNAALHAHTSIDVVIEVGAERLLVEVRDRNPALPQQRGFDEQATTGRGMALVAALTDGCGVHSLGHEGKVVWFCVSSTMSEPTPGDLLNAWDLDGDWDGLEQTSAARTITLPSMPATLWLAARQHHDAILRELVLFLAEHDDVQVDLALADRARGLVSGALVRAVESAQQSGAARPPTPGHPPRLPLVPDSLTLTVAVPPDIEPAYRALQDALDVAEQLALEGKLLVRPGLPEIVAVRDWVCEQAVLQLAGEPATAWAGTAQARFETAVHSAGQDEARWDDSSVRDADRGVVAADTANRIVAISRPLADRLGWDVDDLVGRRVVTLIPPRLREAHVAGFSRHLTTGEAHVLGVPLVLPVLRADGTELSCRFMVERAPQSSGQSVYLAWIEPETDS